MTNSPSFSLSTFHDNQTHFNCTLTDADRQTVACHYSLLLGRDEALNWRAASHSLAFLFWWRYLVTLLCSHTLYSSRLRTVSAIVLSNNLIG
ncbi:MAG: hypothetical protein WBA64_08880 [Marinomonas sp.]|uniref:hypothetical protein n=1 Tax=Marinomonas sp. TaxID=1904862 RepID=UPI003C78CA77